jgi:hypothetical protein
VLDVHSGVIDSDVTCTPLCKYDTAVAFDIIFARLWLPLKGISIEKTYIDHNFHTQKMGVN